jgi:ATP-binding cassette subfamily B protein
MEIPAKKVTAIVGASGSGKTTLIKLLMGIYQPSLGVISLGDIPIHLLDPELYRSSFGAVMQNGYLFSDSIASNICLSDEPIDSTRLFDAGRIANVEEFLKNNPLGYNTEIGLEGMGLSQGQKQRILIARAVYKSPEILFFDEATNSLDADNEKIIQTNLQPFYMGRTVVIVAHRLSTVMNADRIFVLDKGRLVETGTHGSLVNSRGVYYNLVKNQIELRL